MEVGKLIQRYKEEYDQERKALEGKTTYDFSHLDQNRKKNATSPFTPTPLSHFAVFSIHPTCLLRPCSPFIRDPRVLHVSTYSKETNMGVKMKRNTFLPFSIISDVYFKESMFPELELRFQPIPF